MCVMAVGGTFSQFDEIAKHEEFRHFTNPQTGLPAKRFGNTLSLSNDLYFAGFRGHLLVDVKKQLNDVQRHWCLQDLM